MNPNEPAFPESHWEDRTSALQAGRVPRLVSSIDLTKREFFAALAMQACIQLPSPIKINGKQYSLEQAAVGLADCVIAELSKEPKS